MATKPMGIRLDAETQDRLKALAEKKDRTPHYLMKAAVEAYVHREESRQAELDILRNRREHFDVTDISHTTEDMREWAKGLKTRFENEK